MMVGFQLCLWGLPSSIRRIAALAHIVIVVAFLSPAASFGHEGHDHDDAAVAALVSSTYPRVTAQSELYEVVGILKGGRLAIYIDQFTTNEPVTDAKVMVTIGNSEAVEAERAQDGSYSLSLTRLGETGHLRSSCPSVRSRPILAQSSRACAITQIHKCGCGQDARHHGKEDACNSAARARRPLVPACHLRTRAKIKAREA
jgi:hypothetical protein